MSKTDFHFQWDTAKAIANFRQHRIRFEESMGVFEDPLALTRHDDGHGRAEERWVTLGQADERGKFYREGARLIGPVHVAPDVAAQLSKVAAMKGVTSSDLANEIL
jgi:hypothetical protein